MAFAVLLLRVVVGVVAQMLGELVVAEPTLASHPEGFLVG